MNSYTKWALARFFKGLARALIMVIFIVTYPICKPVDLLSALYFRLGR